MAVPLPVRKRLGPIRRSLFKSSVRPADAAPEPPDPRFARLVDRTISPVELTGSPVTDILYSRMSDADVAAMEKALTSDEVEQIEGMATDHRRRSVLALAVHHRLPGTLEKTGLSAATPPEQVHTMGRGPFAAGGTVYYADMAIEALSATGRAPADCRAALDFGCSSGRVVRVLGAAYPEVRWHGCDPIDDAIDWAGTSLPGIDFILSPQAPPLPYEDGSFDFVFAISIWSHYSEPAALAWLNEMHRIIAPGGALVLTAHGYQSLSHGTGSRRVEQLIEIETRLYRQGHWFCDEFGKQGDHGIKSVNWGTAFFSPEWLLANVRGAWDVCGFVPGLCERNQDLYALRRR